MGGRLIWSLLLAGLLAKTVLGQEMDCTVTLSAGDGIQRAIDRANPGDVICLKPGLYTPSATIEIDERVTLRGPQAGVDPRPCAGTVRIAGDVSTEAIIDGGKASSDRIILVTADNVVLEGLEVRDGRGELISTESATPTSSVILRFNLIHGSPHDEGVRLRNTENSVIRYNYIYATGGDGMKVCCGSTDGTIELNEVDGPGSDPSQAPLYQ